jgi:hypothetical protein
MNTLECLLHTADDSVLLWESTRSKMEGTNWPRKVDREIGIWADLVAGGELPHT